MEEDEVERDRQLAVELEALKKERSEIIDGSGLSDSGDLVRVQKTLEKKLQIARDTRDYKRESLCLHLELEKKRAWDEFLQGKSQLRNQIVATHMERRRRLDQIKATAVAKRRRRTKMPGAIPVKATMVAALASGSVASARAGGTAAGRHYLASSLEAQGLVRVALSPDEVNRDIAAMLARLDSVRASAGASGGADSMAGLNGSPASNPASAQLPASHPGSGTTPASIAGAAMIAPSGGATGQSGATGPPIVAVSAGRSVGAAQTAATHGGTTVEHSGVDVIGRSATSGATHATGTTIVRKAEAIHSSRGILNFYEQVFEKGDKIVAHQPGKANQPKYSGVILSINSKEIQIKSTRPGADAKAETNRVYVSHLRKGLIRIKHA